MNVLQEGFGEVTTGITGIKYNKHLDVDTQSF